MNCYKCDISVNRKTIVWGKGKTPCDIMLVGEAPGYYEDKEGLPFVGKSGELLSSLLRDINLDRSSVYITNIIRCRPQNNREPKLIEIKNCIPFLVNEVVLANPKIIVSLGSTATSLFRGLQPVSISHVRGKPFILGRRIILPTFHPSYILRNEEKINEISEDFMLLSKIYSLINPYYVPNF